jgi:hypothetical protein
MGNYTQITDHVERAKARQVEFFKNKDNLNKLIQVIAEEVQAMENTINDFHEQRSLSTASGIQLDNLGEYLNVERGTDSDDSYRARLQTEIQALNKGGQVEALITAYRSLISANKVVVDQYFPATVIVSAEVDDMNISNPSVVNAAMQRVRAAGVELVIGVALSGTSFRFASAPGQYGTGRGFSSTALGGDGGKFAKILR